MENILTNIVLSQKETKKELAAQTKVLNQILQIETKRAAIDKVKLNEEKRKVRAGKKAATDEASTFMNKLKGEAKKGKLTDSILNGPKGLIGGLVDVLKKGAIIAGIVGAIGTAIYQYVNNKEFKDAVNSMVSTIWNFTNDKILVPIGDWFIRNIPNWMNTALTFLEDNGPRIYNFIKKEIVDPLIEYLKTAAGQIYQTMTGNKQATSGKEIATDIAAETGNFFDRTLTGAASRSATRKQVESITNKLGQEGAVFTGPNDPNFEKQYAQFQVAKSMLNSITELENMQEQYDYEKGRLEEGPPWWVGNPEGWNKGKKKQLENLQINITQKRRMIAAQEKAFNELTEELGREPVDFTPLYKQRGGHIDVPGQGSGDKVPMMLPSGSFVMNRNAAAMLQSGGLVPTLLEPGEKVFGPGQWGPMEQMMNQTFGRFQNGGEASVTGTERGGSDDSASKATHDYLIKLNDANIKKVSAPPGYCVTGTLETMEASGVPNPAATGGVPGNNPRGGAVQLINKFGWGAMAGSPITLAGGTYGDAPSAVLSASQYGSLVAQGKIPSGAIIFQTKHDDWNGTSPGSRGYDMAIAQQGGNALWNGQAYGSPFVYSNTKKVMALTPGGEAGKFGGGLNSMFGEQAGNYLSELGGSLSKLGSAILDSFFDVFELPSELKDMVKNPMGSISNLMGGMFGGGGGGMPTSGPAAPLTGDNMSKAKAMHDYIVSLGYSSAQAKGIVANIERESTFNATARSGDDRGPGGLFQWKGSRQTPEVARLVNSGDWKGQIRYALQEDVGPRYKSETAGMNAFDASMWWAEKWERPASLQNARNKHASFLPRYGFQEGGVVNMAGTNSYSNTNMLSKSQEMFAEKIAEAVTPVVIPVGGGGGGGSITQGNVSQDMMMPDLPSGDSSIVAMEYKYRITMGASV